MAIVTGAARGIGKASAVELAKSGADLVVCDICAPEEAQSALEDIGSQGRRALFVQADVGDRASVERLFTETLNACGRVDILVNNAARSIRKLLVDLEVADVEKVWATSLWGVFHCSQLAARQMIKQGNGGSIIVISSVHAVRPFANSTAYNGAKAAVNNMARTWAVELAPHRIRVNVVEPGWIDTPGERQFASEEWLQEEGKKLPLGRLGRPEDIASAVAFLASDQASYITGAILRVDGGFVLPRLP